MNGETLRHIFYQRLINKKEKAKNDLEEMLFGIYIYKYINILSPIKGHLFGTVYFQI